VKPVSLGNFAGNHSKQRMRPLDLSELDGRCFLLNIGGIDNCFEYRRVFLMRRLFYMLNSNWSHNFPRSSRLEILGEYY